MGTFSSVPVPLESGATQTLVHHFSSPHSDSARNSGLAAQPHAQEDSISGLPRHRCRPDLQREQLSHSPWFPWQPSPRTAGHFVFVRYVELHEQFVALSRTAQLSGASPVFSAANPLSRRVLFAVCSVRFHRFPGTSAPRRPLLSTRPRGRLHAFAPGKARCSTGATPLTPCSCADPLADFDSASCLPVGYDRDFRGLDTTLPDCVVASRRASVRFQGTGGTPMAGFDANSMRLTAFNIPGARSG